MGLFPQGELRVRIHETVSFAGPLTFDVQAKGGKYGRLFWMRVKEIPEGEYAEVKAAAERFCHKHGARLCE